MKRLILLLLAYAVGGAIINVAVAWGCRYWSQSEIETGEQVTGLGFTVDYEASTWVGDVSDHMKDIRIGWPMRSLRVDPLCSIDKWICGHCNSSATTILVPGFVVNTILYSAILWLLYATPGFVRRHIRIKRGRCAACGYDLRGRAAGSNLCPECGANA